MNITLHVYYVSWKDVFDTNQKRFKTGWKISHFTKDREKIDQEQPDDGAPWGPTLCDYPLVSLAVFSGFISTPASPALSRSRGEMVHGGNRAQTVSRGATFSLCSAAPLRPFHELSKQAPIPQPLPVSVRINRYKDVAHTARGRNKTEAEEKITAKRKGKAWKCRSASHRTTVKGQRAEGHLI